MNATIVMGSAVVVAALAAMVLLVLWSTRAIHRIAREHLHTARDIVRERNNGR